MIKTVSLTLPTLQDNTADAERLKDALKRKLKAGAVDIDLDLLKTLPEVLRENAFRVRCFLICDDNRWRVIHVSRPEDPAPVTGLAIDLGTTRISLRLIDLLSGAVMTEAAYVNPQTAFGADILTRIHYAEKENGLSVLNEAVIDSLNQWVAGICSENHLEPGDILMLSLAGNTAMTHFFMGLNPGWMIREPYIPVVNRPGFLKAAELGINVHPRARIFIFPNIGSYFGGDLIAGILFSGIHRNRKPSILIDVGTNAEVVIGNKDWMIACAGAAGPALEGSVTRMGMLAGPGVIDGVRIDTETGGFSVHTIGGLPPAGICGSGLIELAARLFLAGMIDTRGRFVASACGERLIDDEGIKHLIVVPGARAANGSDMRISQIELDSLVRSKAAMFSILETITALVNITFEDLATFYIAGAFGTFINPEAAIAIGMMPDIPLERFTTLGNSSLGGAGLALSLDAGLAEIDRIRDRITYHELNVNQEFMNRFSAARFLPHADPERFPSVKVPVKDNGDH